MQYLRLTTFVRLAVLSACALLGACAEGAMEGAGSDGAFDSRCGADLMHDVLNCGACGVACPHPFDHTIPTCIMGQCGFTCADGYGGAHPFSGASKLSTGVYWGGWDIARAVWLMPTATLSAPAGYVLDGYGGIHPFGGAPAISGAAYFPGNDIAKRLAGF